MSDITVPLSLFHRLADVIQDMGNHRPNFRGTEVGADLNVLGNTIKYCGPLSGNRVMDLGQRDWLAKAQAVISKHGGGRAGLSPVEQCVETAEKLLGLWTVQGAESCVSH